jgi:predicted nucleic acid-binding protein
MFLFLDTNILLAFYHLTKEDIEELRKLVQLIEHGEVKLIVPTQVEDEFHRNRDNKINNALSHSKATKFNIGFPSFCKDYTEYDFLQAVIKEVDKKHSNLLKTASEHAKNRTLKADALVDSIFGKAEKIAISDEVYSAAKKRSELGNPPGKKGSIGDAINWECLLTAVPNGKDLFFVADDVDYRSNLSDDEMHYFLLKEWEDRKASKIYFFRSISALFKAKLPDIKLASEVEKELLIKKLAGSSNFASTHSLIAKLSTMADFTLAQVEQLVAIPEANSQVGWIVGDKDVNDFYKAVYSKYSNKLKPDVASELAELIESEGEVVLGEDDDTR